VAPSSPIKEVKMTEIEDLMIVGLIAWVVVIGFMLIWTWIDS
jgi:Flp pilus assembly pilin Flp